ncbi:alpha-glucoside-specific PTS transporter subunit IIBC [Clostridium sp. AL.422]|uniref:alpha-glucoside-specific PTS transporter subunit IIBC n=1 Tax=Clostridium TaxID=1485 RepID=UPI00293DBFD1|nr:MULTISPECIES: alpha-glucoside-specific PTS transporter subunit IIBC [unclassified Clostridium]MDV4150438.1 alpha-glucoside-specific PTS transporter subunit IIBC [Clostridium sp. AL.422]
MIQKVMQKVQRFGGAMFTPVLLFTFAGIMVGLSILFKNQEIMGTLANENGTWYKFWLLIEEGAWTVFRQLPLLFAIGLPIGLAKKQQARACMESFVIYLTFNYFLSAILQLWGPAFGVNFALEAGGGTGLATIAGIKTLDTGMVGAILISGIVVYIHNRYFDTELPEYLGTFKGSTFVYIIGFFVMIPVAFAIALIWPKVQGLIASLQEFLKSSGGVGVWTYTFLERILIPTGLHHFIYSPFMFDSAVVEGGISVYWAAHLSEFSTSGASLKELFPAGGFGLYGLSKVFGAIGISTAIYSTAKKEKKKLIAGLLIPATLTAVATGITEPLEFTFLFIAPVLFFVHALLAATLSTISFSLGVVGNFSNGLIEWSALNWIPLFKYHASTYITQIIIGLIFILIYFFVFRFLILKFNFKTPGREEEDESSKLYTKADFKEKQKNSGSEKARLFLEALGGKDNIADVTNCATRLRLTVKDENLVKDASEFKRAGAHGVVKNGKSIQIVVGLSVPKVRDDFESLL